MTINLTFSPWWIPSILQIIMLIHCFFSLTSNNGYWTGLYEILLLMVTTPLIWGVFFMIMYFCK